MWKPEIVLVIACADDQCWGPIVRELRRRYEKVFLFTRPGATKILGDNFDALRIRALKLDLEDIISLENMQGKKFDLAIGGHDCARDSAALENIGRAMETAKGFGLGQYNTLLPWVREDETVEFLPEGSAVAEPSYRT